MATSSLPNWPLQISQVKQPLIKYLKYTESLIIITFKWLITTFIFVIKLTSKEPHLFWTLESVDGTVRVGAVLISARNIVSRFSHSPLRRLDTLY